MVGAYLLIFERMHDEWGLNLRNQLVNLDFTTTPSSNYAKHPQLISSYPQLSPTSTSLPVPNSAPKIDYRLLVITIRQMECPCGDLVKT